MSANADLAEALRTIADLLDLAGERFKPEAYRRAARTIETLAEDVRTVSARGGLTELPGVGEAIADKAEEFLRTGTIRYLDRLKTELPGGLLEVMRLPGVGPKTARRFWTEFGIEGPAELGAALAGGRFAGAKGFGARKIEQLAAALKAGAPGGGARTPLRDAWGIARLLVDGLRSAASIDRIEIAGSLRRRRETVGDLDLLATTRDPEPVLEAFGHLAGVTAVTLRGPTKSTVVVDGTVQVDLRVVAPEAFGAALQYFTGSKDHNVRLRTRARDQGLKVNEYGVFRGEERVAGSTEEEVYAALGLPWIPPEIREDRGEIDAAAAGTLPRLVDRGDLTGDLHLHLPATTTGPELDRLLRSARATGLLWVGIVVDGPDDGPLAAAVAERERPADDRAAAHRMAERPVGSPPVPGDAPWIASAQDAPAPPAAVPDGAPVLLAHLPAATRHASLAAWAGWAAETGAALDVTPRPEIDGLDAAAVRAAVDAGARLHVSAGVGSPSDPLEAIELALGLARRGWAPPESVINRRDPTSPAARRPAPARPPRRRRPS